MSFKEIKNWGPESEKEIVEEWKNSEMFQFKPKEDKKIYSIDTPPPYVNAPVHIGQAVTYCYRCSHTPIIYVFYGLCKGSSE